ncbi:MAG: hypothetical protein KC912_09145 [Proteobacteria bacterium]|nr:hypothetical protein [Pseudomonadota bacterium]
MSAEVLYALLERLHGHLGWLGLAVLLHPVITLGKGRGVSRRMQLSADLAALLMAAPFALGAVIYPTYRSGVKPELVAQAPAVAAVFETKEHLAVFAVALAISGALVLRGAGKSAAGRRAARSMLAGAFVCAVMTGLAGLWVASHAHPAW